jgi:hypothetical protein
MDTYVDVLFIPCRWSFNYFYNRKLKRVVSFR